MDARETPHGIVHRYRMPLVWLAVAALVPAVLLAVAWPRNDASDSAETAGAGTRRVDLDAGPGGPSRPPARVCGSPALEGPARPPAGYVRVSTAQDLAPLVDASPDGTRFWLEPGVHQLGADEFDQVQPKDEMVFLGGPGTILDGRGLNLYAFGGHAQSVTIAHLTIRRFGGRLANRDQGVVNHDAASGWRIRDNTIKDNGGAGVFIGDRNVVAQNCLRDNGQYGFSAYAADGVRDVELRGNEITGNNTADWESRRPGCGCAGGGKFWETTDARITSNWIHHNHGPGIWADTNNAAFLISRNLISDNDAEGVFYETSYNAEISSNTFLRNGIAKGREGIGFPTAAVYISESGGDRRVETGHAGLLQVVGNTFVDNWGGVVGWENADRFAGSPANTSTGHTTLVNPSVATLDACGDPDLITRDPYIDDCRWKTQNLRVSRNVFRFEPGRLGRGCSAEGLCGFNGLFSQWGTYPEWSPYHGTKVERGVTLEQSNLWSNNVYVGPWRFMAMELGNQVSWSTWRGRYGQDGGSTLH